MIITKELNQNEIAEVIARYFDMPVESVEVECYETTEGYNMAEHTVYRAKATITFTLTGTTL